MKADYRGDRFAAHTHDLRGCIDVLVLTQPDLIRDIQSRYLDAGADILTTNTFTATRYGLSEFGLEDRVYEINHEAARLAQSRSPTTTPTATPTSPASSPEASAPPTRPSPYPPT